MRKDKLYKPVQLRGGDPPTSAAGVYRTAASCVPMGFRDKPCWDNHLELDHAEMKRMDSRREQAWCWILSLSHALWWITDE